MRTARTALCSGVIGLMGILTMSAAHAQTYTGRIPSDANQSLDFNIANIFTVPAFEAVGQNCQFDGVSLTATLRASPEGSITNGDNIPTEAEVTFEATLALALEGAVDNLIDATSGTAILLDTTVPIGDTVTFPTTPTEIVATGTVDLTAGVDDLSPFSGPDPVNLSAVAEEFTTVNLTGGAAGRSNQTTGFLEWEVTYQSTDCVAPVDPIAIPTLHPLAMVLLVMGVITGASWWRRR